jgi:hypothetical protein
MGLLKYPLIVALAAGVLVGTAAARGGAKPPLDSRVVFVGPGATVQVQGIDLTCHVYRRDPRRKELGPLMYCNRTSAPHSSRGIGASMWHFFYADRSGKNRVFPVGRSP